MNVWSDLYAGQLAFFFGWLLSLVLWRYAVMRQAATASERPEPALESATPPALDVEAGAEKPPAAELPTEEKPALALLPTVLTSENPICRALVLDEKILVDNVDVLKMMTEFGVHMLYLFVCDRDPFQEVVNAPFPLEKVYTRDLFFFVYLLFIGYSVATSVQTTKPVYLNRDQTEEWKGWMQVLFLLYHYFNATEQYNSIRVYIAAYVWMTGFGNFSFYYVRRDFSASRFFQMMWRLNFLVFFVCVVMGNDYMLYYICPMHTLWTIVVYLVLFIGKDHNKNQLIIGAKFAACMAFGVLMFWSEEAFTTLWSPTSALMGFTPPNAKPDHKPMHEWYFRAGLDRYVYVFGMLCANLHPRTEQMLHAIDNMPDTKKWAVRGAMVAVLLGLGYYWVVNYLLLDKYAYNAVHPYTSWMPILVFILLRNLTPTLRSYHIHFMGWLGKITLETYICQFHIWLHTGGRNQSPKLLLNLIGGDSSQGDRFGKYPLLNFALVTAIYIFVSYRLFHLTSDLKFVLLPSKNKPLLWRNVALVFSGWLALYGLCYCAKAILG
eukprot:TRINITY_DN16191_c0_g1_i2.p1 TRINITY_DN16191_c0_g1~~TRINITY_DN16191_c0_g1_i2.p1  ORF type:complete len:550 (+),score=178.20 TRINITY_DN16191_c0_g1_i2:61-1710(+)